MARVVSASREPDRVLIKINNGSGDCLWVATSWVELASEDRLPITINWSRVRGWFTPTPECRERLVHEAGSLLGKQKACA